MIRLSQRYLAYSDIRRSARDDRLSAKMRLLGNKTLPALLSHQQREVAAKRIRDVMSGWVKTPFEREGAARHAIRSALCLGGASWAQADQEAAKIVSMALAAMGAQRPSWDEGQPTYVVSEDYCRWCHGPLELSHAGRYCSADCSRFALAHRDYVERAMSDAAYREAYRSMQRLSTPLQPCGHCKKPFHPRIEGGRSSVFCSKSCQSKALAAKVAAAPKVATCVVCREQFLSFGLRPALYCCHACANVGVRAAKGRWAPKRLTKAVFEQCIIGPFDIDSRKSMPDARAL